MLRARDRRTFNVPGQSWRGCWVSSHIGEVQATRGGSGGGRHFPNHPKDTVIQEYLERYIIANRAG